MSSLLVCAQPATGLSGVFVPQQTPVRLIQQLSAVPRLTPVTSAARLDVRPAPERVSGGIEALDNLTDGLPRGCLSEVCGPASSGRTSMLLAAIAAATQRNEACALVDVSNAFDPQSGAAAHIDFKNLLWVRCDAEKDLPRPSASLRTRSGHHEANHFSGLDQALKATDLLLQSGGFGLVAIDLGDVPVSAARRIPLTSWFRFRRAVENTPTVLLVVARSSCARTCASLVIEVQSSAITRHSSGKLSAVSCHVSEKSRPPHGQILTGMEVKAEVLRSRVDRKPVQAATTSFHTRAQHFVTGTAR